MKQVLEIAAFNITAALIAAQAGADRIELCTGRAEGGLTPAPDTIRQARQQLHCPFFVMIRPKGGDFLYNAEEIAVMQADMLQAKDLGAGGFVFGILNKAGEIDITANKLLTALAHPLPCTFHRAFDDVTDKTAALEILIDCGFQRLLTSGGVGNAIDHCDRLAQLVRQAGDRIVVMPGGGIRSSNIGQIRSATHAPEFHSAAITDDSELASAIAVQEMKAAISG